MSDTVKKFHQTYPDIKYPVWKVGNNFFLNSHKDKALAYAHKTGAPLEVVEAPAKSTKGKKTGEQITNQDGTE